MSRLKVTGFSNVSFCMKCAPTRIQVEVEGGTAVIKDDVVFAIKEKRYIGECYPYVVLDGKKYRFELVEVVNEDCTVIIDE